MHGKGGRGQTWLAWTFRPWLFHFFLPETRTRFWKQSSRLIIPRMKSTCQGGLVERYESISLLASWRHSTNPRFLTFGLFILRENNKSLFNPLFPGLCYSRPNTIPNQYISHSNINVGKGLKQAI